MFMMNIHTMVISNKMYHFNLKKVYKTNDGYHLYRRSNDSERGYFCANDAMVSDFLGFSIKTLMIRERGIL